MEQSNESQPYALKSPVFLIGFMGAGKTTVASYLAKRYGVECIDVDDYVERRDGRAIARIFAEDGEDFFRDLETRCLEELSGGVPLLVSCGGGIVKRPRNMRIMEERGFTVYLRTTAEAAAERIPDASSRPLFQNLETARALLVEREPLYSRVADATVDTVGRTVESIARETVAILEDRGIATRSCG